jgi:hypothetical protein
MAEDATQGEEGADNPDAATGAAGAIEKLPLLARPLAFLRERKAQLKAHLVHYGPPYQEEYGGSLPEECQDKKATAMDIHGLLNEGADPRVGDPEDYMNTPLHYAVRNSKLRICKMLRHAGADVNQASSAHRVPRRASRPALHSRRRPTAYRRARPARPA